MLSYVMLYQQSCSLSSDDVTIVMPHTRPVLVRRAMSTGGRSKSLEWVITLDYDVNRSEDPLIHWASYQRRFRSH